MTEISRVYLQKVNLQNLLLYTCYQQAVCCANGTKLIFSNIKRHNLVIKTKYDLKRYSNYRMIHVQYEVPREMKATQIITLIQYLNHESSIP